MDLNKPHSGKQLTDAMASEWHKVCAILMNRQGSTTLDITVEDIAKLESAEKKTVVMHANNDRIRIKLVSDAEVAKLVILHAANGKLGDD